MHENVFGTLKFKTFKRWGYQIRVIKMRTVVRIWEVAARVDRITEWWHASNAYRAIIASLIEPGMMQGSCHTWRARSRIKLGRRKRRTLIAFATLRAALKQFGQRLLIDKCVIPSLFVALSGMLNFSQQWEDFLLECIAAACNCVWR